MNIMSIFRWFIFRKRLLTAIWKERLIITIAGFQYYDVTIETINLFTVIVNQEYQGSNNIQHLHKHEIFIPSIVIIGKIIFDERYDDKKQQLNKLL